MYRLWRKFVRSLKGRPYFYLCRDCGREADEWYYDPTRTNWIHYQCSLCAECYELRCAAGQHLSILYTNYQGETTSRYILPLDVHFGSNIWHSQPQWLLHAYDFDKHSLRDFAIKDIKIWDHQSS